MSGGRGPRQKGFGFEREIVKLAHAAGLTARRLWGSNGTAAGFTEGVDVTIGEKDAWKFQAKRYARIAGFLKRPEGTEGVIIREDNGEALIVLPFTTFLKLVGGVLHNGRTNDSAQSATISEVRDTQRSA